MERRRPATVLLALAAALLTAAGSCGLAAAVQHNADSLQCLQDIQQHSVESFRPFLENFKGRILAFDVATHVNLGDGILWLGMKRLIRQYGRNPDLICAQSQRFDAPPNFPRCPSPEEVARIGVSEPVLLLWHPGGNFGDIWARIHLWRTSYLAQLDSAASRLRSTVTVVQMPQSVFYSSKTLAEPDVTLIQNFKAIKFHLYSRSAYSVMQVEKNLGNVPELTAVSADLAYMVGPQLSAYQPQYDILLLLRADKESSLVGRGADAVRAFFEKPENSGISWTITDWRNFEKSNKGKPGTPSDLADLRWQEAMYTISLGRVVVTNRLHAAVVSLLLHTPAYWFDGGAFSGYGKIHGTMGYAHSLSAKCTPEALQSFPVDGEDEAAKLQSALRSAVAAVKDMRMKEQQQPQAMQPQVAAVASGGSTTAR